MKIITYSPFAKFRRIERYPEYEKPINFVSLHSLHPHVKIGENGKSF